MRRAKSPIEKFEEAMKRRACSWSLMYRGDVKIVFQLKHLGKVYIFFGESLNEAALVALEFIKKGK